MGGQLAVPRPPKDLCFGGEAKVLRNELTRRDVCPREAGRPALRYAGDIRVEAAGAPCGHGVGPVGLRPEAQARVFVAARNVFVETVLRPEYDFLRHDDHVVKVRQAAVRPDDHIVEITELPITTHADGRERAAVNIVVLLSGDACAKAVVAKTAFRLRLLEDLHPRDQRSGFGRVGLGGRQPRFVLLRLLKRGLRLIGHALSGLASRRSVRDCLLAVRQSSPGLVLRIGGLGQGCGDGASVRGFAQCGFSLGKPGGELGFRLANSLEILVQLLDRVFGLLLQGRDHGIELADYSVDRDALKRRGDERRIGGTDSLLDVRGFDRGRIGRATNIRYGHVFHHRVVCHRRLFRAGGSDALHVFHAIRPRALVEAQNDSVDTRESRRCVGRRVHVVVP